MVRPRVCVYGAGAIGCHIAGHLARSGDAIVSVVDRGHNVSAIHENGIHVLTPEERFRVDVNATTDPKTLGVQDYVIIALKIQQAVSSLDQIATLVGPDTTIVPPSTGVPYYFFHNFRGRHDDARLREVDPDGQQWRTLPPSQVVPMVFWVGAHRLSPGVTQQDGNDGSYLLGELDGNTSERLRCLASVFEKAGASAPVTNNIRGEIWTKFANSVCGNPIAALTLSDMKGFATSPGVLRVFETMLTEVDAIGADLGVSIPQPVAERIAFTLSTGEHKYSMLQDLEGGRPLEIEEFTKSLAAVKRLSSRETPVCDSVLPLMELRNAVHEKHP